MGGFNRLPGWMGLALRLLSGLPAAYVSSWSCSPGNYSGPVASIRFGTSLLEPCIPIFIAEDRQYFAGNGLNVTVKYYDSGLYLVNGLRDMRPEAVNINISR
jgi:ABC-type nitrate/sulfonate/bicarbonate transport system substrate-binding protein